MGYSCSALLLLLSVAAFAQPTGSTRPSLVLEGKAAKLAIDLAGGSLTSFLFADQGLNPLTWDSKGNAVDPRPMGHFLCLDRWGAPSAAEQRNGMPFHGEASRVLWRVIAPPAAKNGVIASEMTAALPIAGLEVRRRVELATDVAFLRVTEQVTNTNKLGRIYNMVQHPTVGPPFLSEETLIDANAGKGFMQNSPLPDPEQRAVAWPQAMNKDQKVDMRRLTADPDPNVVSYVIDGEYGWVTASSPSQGLLIGYIWKTSDYPWFNAWRHSEAGKPAARGLEFGTTGLHQPFPILVKKGRIFDRPLYGYLDAQQTESRSYGCFLFRIPLDFKGVSRILHQRGELRLIEQGPGGRELTMKLENGSMEQ